jgi:predicted nucleotidyltransferase
MDMLSKIFSTKQREMILDHMLNNPSAGYRVRELSKDFSVSVGSISQFLSLLKTNRILVRRGDVFFVDTKSALTKALKIILNVFKIEFAVLKRIPGLLGVGLYGSWANGTNREDSDIDIWLKIKERIGEEVVAGVSRQLNNKMKRNVQLLVLDPGKIELLKKEDPIFFYSLVFGSVVIYGEVLED